jgi:hypothetical protein
MMKLKRLRMRPTVNSKLTANGKMWFLRRGGTKAMGTRMKRRRVTKHDT